MHLENTDLDIIFEDINNGKLDVFISALQKYFGVVKPKIKFKIFVKKLQNDKHKDSLEYNKTCNEVISFAKEVYTRYNTPANLQLKEIFEKMNSNLMGRLHTYPPEYRYDLLLENILDCLNGKIINKKDKETYEKLYDQYFKRYNDYNSKKKDALWHKLDEINHYLVTYTYRTDGIKNQKDQFLPYLIQFHKAYMEFKTSYGEEFNEKKNEFLNSLKKEGGLKSLLKINSIYNDELWLLNIILYSIFAIFLILMAVYSSKQDIGRSLELLGITSKLNLDYYMGSAIIWITIICVLLFIKYCITKLKDYESLNYINKHFLNRFLNGYFLLSTSLILLFVAMGLNLLTFQYGSSFPKPLDFKNAAGYPNFIEDNIDEITGVCNGRDDERFFIKDKEAICNITLKIKKESNFKFNYMNKCIWDNKNNICKPANEYNYLTNYYLEINPTEEGEFEFKVEIYGQNNSNTLINPINAKFKDKVRTIEEIQKLENEKITLFFAIISLGVFSILSGVQNIKELTKE
ncbi:MAG: hypothetical protein WC471_04185 [Candidatus Woesearchaeota archaeon]